MHIGHAHFPSERRSCDSPAAEVEVMVRWISHPPTDPELVDVITSSE